MVSFFLLEDALSALNFPDLWFIQLCLKADGISTYLTRKICAREFVGETVFANGERLFAAHEHVSRFFIENYNEGPVYCIKYNKYEVVLLSPLLIICVQCTCHWS